MRLLVAEDDDELRDVLRRGLIEADYVVDTVADGEEALNYLRVYEYALCILDWRMPRLSGIEVVAKARQRGVRAPFLMLTARDAPVDRIAALDEGADDYLIKPFDYGELLARVRALLRRPAGDRAPKLRCGSLVLDPSTREVFVDGDLINLTARESAVLELLLRRSPAVVQRESIALHAWSDGADPVGSNTIDVHIARLRAKIARSDARIQTVRGSGYRLVPPT
jgi:two-component system copper resistance phosphate regulon response regulator CusR